MSNFYNQASWVLVPSGIEEDIVFAQKPISGLGDLTFTRASDATYTDSTGVVRRSPYNLVTFSEMFSDASWSKTTGVVVTPNAILAPNNTLTADYIQMGAANRAVTQATSLRIGVSCTSSIYIKGIAGETIALAAGGVDSPLITLTGEWQRITYTATSIQSWINVNTFNGATARNFYLWGAQLVEGTSALDYFPTTNRQDVPRIDFRNADGTLSSCGRLLLEPQRTNSIRNSSMVGAVAGSPGTLPTNWNSSNGGLTRTIVGIGTENGIPYIDLRFNGNATSGAVTINFDNSSAIAAAPSQTWNLSSYAKLISGTINAAQLLWDELNSSLGYVTTKVGTVTIGSNLSRVSYTNTTSANCAFVYPLFRVTLTIGAAYDFTIRIAAPQMELGAFATTWVPTTTAAVTRLADLASKTGVSSLIGQTEGTLFVDVNLDSRVTQSYFAISLSAISTTNYIGFGFKATTIVFEVVTGGVLQAIGTFTNSSIGSFKLAIGYKSNDFVFYVNGTQIGTDNSGTVPACNDIVVYNSTYGQSQSMKINQAALFQTRLTNTQLAQLTTL